MIVVSDTSPLNYLVLISAIDVLPKLFEQVYVPPSVIGELTRLKTPDIVREWATSPPTWLAIVAPTSRLPSTAALDEGEADALSLAASMVPLHSGGFWSRFSRERRSSDRRKPRDVKAVLKFLPLCHAARATKWQNEKCSHLCAAGRRNRTR
jgi:hypothetical protein